MRKEQGREGLLSKKDPSNLMLLKEEKAIPLMLLKDLCATMSSTHLLSLNKAPIGGPASQLMVSAPSW